MTRHPRARGVSGTVSAAVIVVDGTLEGVVRCIKLQVNTTGVWLCCREAARRMVAAGRGVNKGRSWTIT